MSRRTLKRAQSPKLEVSNLHTASSYTLGKEKRRKLGKKRLNNSKRSNITEIKPNNNSFNDSSDSSSDGFEKPPPVSELELGSFDIKKETAESDFTTIENSILKGVTRLSESDDSDFDEVGVTSPHSSSVKRDNPENGNSSTKKYVKNEVDSIKTSKNRQSERNNSSKGKNKGKSRQNKPDTKQSAKKNASKSLSSVEIDKMDISQLLALGEGSRVTIPKSEIKHSSSESDTENDVSDWEDVKGLDVKPEKHTIPQEGVEVRLEMPDIYRRRKKKSFDMESHLRRRLNRIKRELQVLIHKVHLLCWIAHGRYVNEILNSEVLMGISLSLIPSQHCFPEKHTNLNYLEQIVKWFSKTVILTKTPEENSTEPLLESLQRQFQSKTASSVRDLVLMFICLLRAIGVKVRLMLSFQPLPLKPSTEDLLVSRSKARRSSTLSQTKELKTDIKEEIAQANDESSILSKSTAKKDAKQSSKTPKKSEETKTSRKLEKESTYSSKKKTQSPKVTKETRNATDITDDKMEKLPLKPSTEDLLVSRSKTRRSSTLSQTKELKTDIKEEIAQANDESSILSKSTAKKDAKQSSKTPKKSEETKTSRKLEKESTYSSKKKTQSPKVTKETRNASDITDDKMEKLKRTLRHRKEIANKYKEYSSSSDENGSEKVNKAFENNKSGVRSNNKNSIQKIPSTSGTKQSLGKEEKTVIQGTGSKRKSSVKEKSRKTSGHNSDSDFEPVLKKPSEMKKIDMETCSESENDFEPRKTAKKRKSTGTTIDRRVLSSDSSGDGKKRNSKKCIDVWTEVYLEEEEQWISVDVPTARVHCVAELHSRATQPVTYVIGFSNNLTLKDLTRRYCAQFSTVTRKLRVDEGWWKQSLKPFLGPRNAQDREEDEELDRLMLDRPLPTTFKELKNHPLYALKEDLLKFEAIYPPDAPPLGYIKGKPIYARECVHVLHSREAWIKEAKVVRLGEKPYKIVKARPKYDKMTGQFVKDLPLEVFGSWQVEDYIPPVAVDGKVPRNEYGNVELFKPSMLPKGTVHLPVTGLNRVARKLGIDCAPAMIGFDFHAGGTHPVFDGFVVCEEFKDTLLDAWNQEQDEAEKRQQEKLEKRVYGNWKRLIKGLLIRERLKLRYSFGEEAGPSEPRLLSSISESNKLLSVIDGSSRKKKKGNVGRGRKSNNVSRPSGDSQKGKKRVTHKKRKVESEEEEESSESDDDTDDFGSDKDWD